MGITDIGRRRTLLLALALFTGCGDDVRQVAAAESAPQGGAEYIHALVTTRDGETYRGPLRFGGDEEAFWADYFNGVKAGNPWVEHVPGRKRPGDGIRIFGYRFGGGVPDDLKRPFMARMGDIARIEADGRDLWVTLRSGTRVHLDRWSADDFADGVRIRDEQRGVVDLGERGIRSIEFMPSRDTAPATSNRLHGTVHTADGAFTGFVQWARRGNVALDELKGRTPDDEEVSLPYATLRSISRESGESARVTLLDGRELVLSDIRRPGASSGIVYVDDVRYGRVLVDWDAFRRLDFTPAGAPSIGSSPTYSDFAPGRPLAGTVTTTGGAQHTGRIVFDLDESETTETLDAPRGGVHYTLPFDLVHNIELPGGGGAGGPVTVTLRSGERLALERADDLGPDNGGVLIFGEGGGKPAYVEWKDVARLTFGSVPGE